MENQEELHIIPSSYEIEEGLKMAGTKVLMKAAAKDSLCQTGDQRAELKSDDGRKLRHGE